MILTDDVKQDAKVSKGGWMLANVERQLKSC